MPKRFAIAALFVSTVALGGCGLARHLSPPDPEHLELLEEQRRQEVIRTMERQAIQAHEQAMQAHEQAMQAHEQAARMHQPMSAPPPE